MRLRATLATLLTFVLMSTSCFASACHLACSLKISGPTCHPSDSSMMGNPRSHECPMHPHRASDRATATDVKSPETCSSPACAQQAQAIEADQSESSAPMAWTLTAVVAPLISLPTQTYAIEHRLPETPPLRPPVLVSLQTTLRI